MASPLHNDISERVVSPGPSTRASPAAGFTLIEVLVVVAIVALLASLLLPSLSGAKIRGQRTACANNLRQLAVCLQMYAADNEGRLAQNQPASTNSWVAGNISVDAEATNAMLLRSGQIFAYATQPVLYRCPGDPSQAEGHLRVRSYAMNSWIGSRHMETLASVTAADYRTFVKENELNAAGPARLWVLADEHEVTIDDGCFLIQMLDVIASSPATRHGRSFNLNFGDGHVQTFKFRFYDPAGSQSTGKPRDAWQPAATQNTDPDWAALRQVTTVR